MTGIEPDADRADAAILLSVQRTARPDRTERIEQMVEALPLEWAQRWDFFERRVSSIHFRTRQ